MSSDTRSRALPMHHIGEESALAPRFLVGAFEDMGPGPFAEVPHRHEFTELVYVTEGAGTHLIDLEAHRIQPPHLFFVARGQVHHWKATRPVRGTIVLFRDDFLVGAGGPEDIAAGLELWNTPSMHPTIPQRARLERLLAELQDEFAAGDRMQEFALRTLVNLLLIHCRRMTPAPERGAPPNGLVGDFLHLVNEHASATLTVAACAMRLAVTPGHLSDLVVTQTGSTPGEIIRAATLREAQRLLARTDLTCAQIAARVGFDDASYFSRFFRRETGATPSQFRAQVAA